MRVHRLAEGGREEEAIQVQQVQSEVLHIIAQTSPTQLAKEGNRMHRHSRSVQ